MIDIDRYLALRDRPDDRPVMFQTWRNLLFAHFPADPAAIQALLPSHLTVDPFDGVAWIGVVLFEMVDVRFVGVPAIPGTDYFPEFNVRTYVHRRGEDPGVWFFSLDAANPLAVAVARRFFRLPYYSATMRVDAAPTGIDYASTREGANSKAHVDTGASLPLPEPGSFEFFLVERYLLHARGPNGACFTGRVHHAPYRLRAAENVTIEESLTSASRIPRADWAHFAFCDGVDVTAHRLRRVPTR